MKKLIFLFSISLLFFNCAEPKVKQGQYTKPVNPTKNVILMIPDGTSIGVVSAARWYQIYNKLGADRLAIDPYLCGTVKTYNSNSPVGDSAPTTSCYMTGYLSQAGNVAIYPAVDTVHDIHPVDPAKSYQPLTTVLEAAKYDLKKSTGLVVTVEFPHATPADCSSHYYDRGNYKYLASQIANNDIDVVFGGGVNLLTDPIRSHLEANGTQIITDDIEAFRTYDSSQNVWALFGDGAMPLDMDRDETQFPSLEEMTRTAIEVLSKNENGFFLMVEGSQIDWSAHSNDAVSMITEYLAFDRAVQAAIDFAEKDGNTTVIVVSDHGNSGFTIGVRGFKNYASRGLDDYFKTISGYQASARQMHSLLLQAKPEEYKNIVKEKLGIDLTNEEYKTLVDLRGTLENDYTKVGYNPNFESCIVQIMNARTPFGFTTGGHTGEDVLLAAYHPQGHVPSGMNTNIELNKYLCDVVGLTRPLDDITNEIFAKHSDVFAGMDYKIDTTQDFPVLTVKNGANELVIPAFSSVVKLNGEDIKLNSVTVYMDKNDTFYVPKVLKDKLKK